MDSGFDMLGQFKSTQALQGNMNAPTMGGLSISAGAGANKLKRGFFQSVRYET